MEAINEFEYVVGVNGEKKAVIIPWEEYVKLMEDLEDLKVIAERKEEEEITLEELKERLRRDGLLN